MILCRQHRTCSSLYMWSKHSWSVDIWYVKNPEFQYEEITWMWSFQGISNHIFNQNLLETVQNPAKFFKNNILAQLIGDSCTWMYTQKNRKPCLLTNLHHFEERKKTSQQSLMQGQWLEIVVIHMFVKAVSQLVNSQFCSLQ